MIYLFLGVGVIMIVWSNFYIYSFQESIQGTDERGKIIQLQMSKIMYNILFLGILIILIFNALNIISNHLSINIIFGLILLNSIFGALFIYFQGK